MAFFDAVFIKTAGRPHAEVAQEVLTALRERIDLDGREGVLRYRDVNPWLSLGDVFDDVACHLAQDLNVETIWVSGQTVVDYYQYKHFLEKKCVRELEYCPEFDPVREVEGWITVKGAPERWETEVLFEDQDEVLELLHDMLSEEQDPQKRKHLEQQIKSIEKQEIAAGHSFPSFHIRDVAKAYGFPGFYLDEPDPRGESYYWSFEEAV